MMTAMMPWSSKLLYSGGIMPLPVITRPKISTNSSGTKLRRATRASRASIARKVFQFIPAGSFSYGAGTGFPDWAPRCAHR